MPKGISKNPEETRRKLRIASLRNGNIPPSWLGKKLSEEHKRKLSEVKKGKNNYLYGKKGEKSPVWKGDKISYSGLHKWVTKELGRPHFCEHCGNRDLKHR